MASQQLAGAEFILGLSDQNSMLLKSSIPDVIALDQNAITNSFTESSFEFYVEERSGSNKIKTKKNISRKPSYSQRYRLDRIIVIFVNRMGFTDIHHLIKHAKWRMKKTGM